ncbi:uncharacterized protein AB675_4010 [Cyphellophora attinorum]|uniref:Uncharacterized protein n=1 Tax=Cyphellophora attinorum TaxID=1664694 RepID=A0A0N1H5D6_9EURO|nr:uncharacterized protein AB675_4010 [Phialophora attinorum]KPI37566.1 hypothetical protein AB675_4010 [Phialophora attinorum]
MTAPDDEQRRARQQEGRNNRRPSRGWSQQQEEEEDEENGLTELAAPAPASPEQHVDDLSREQSRAAEEQRSVSEGDEAGLTEVAAPVPVAERESGDALEDEEETVAKAVSDGGSTYDYVDAGTASGAAPEKARGSQESAPAEGSGEEEKVTGSAQASKAATAWNEAVIAGCGGADNIPIHPFRVDRPLGELGRFALPGFLLEDRRLFRKTVPAHLITDNKEAMHGHIARHQKTLPLYIGLATGFCGSFTSFSTFITDAFLALANRLASASPTSPYHTIPATSISARNGGYSFLAVVGVFIVHPAVSISALKTGAHLALATERVMPGISQRLFSRWLDCMVLALGLGCWIGAVLLSIFPPGPASAWRSRATLPLVFSPPGALLRFYLSMHLNSRVPSFPLGTFAANIIGTVVEAVCYVLQHTDRFVVKNDLVEASTCTVLQGLMQGFCGCLTTVSTWVAELNGLRRRHAWLYGLMSVAVALGFQVAIMGSVLWTRGFVDSCEAFA